MADTANRKVFLGDWTGAFGDGAILFPILYLLVDRCGYNPTRLFVSAGIIFILSGLYFKIPFPVQPLKSLALVATTLGATQKEVQLAGALVGLFCLLFSLVKKSAQGRDFISIIMKKIPICLVHSVQSGLGLLLLLQAFRIGQRAGWPHHFWLLIGICLVFLVILNFSVKSFYPLGIISLFGVLFGLLEAVRGEMSLPQVPVSLAGEEVSIRLGFLAAMVLPQIPLTLANSVLATCHVTEKYFGTQARRCNPRSVMRSIGFGNLLTAVFAGIPFCHGAGGVTAHYYAGSRSNLSNFVMGSFLIVFGIFGFRLVYSTEILVVLLGLVGIFHIKLAEPTWKDSWIGRFILVVNGLSVLFTQNLSIGLGIVGLLSFSLLPKGAQEQRC